MWRLYPSNLFERLFRPCLMSGSAMAIRRLGATPLINFGLPSALRSISCFSICLASAKLFCAASAIVDVRSDCDSTKLSTRSSACKIVLNACSRALGSSQSKSHAFLRLLAATISAPACTASAPVSCCIFLAIISKDFRSSMAQ